MIAQNKIRISVTIIPFINDLLEKISKKSGISKSLLVEKSLKDFLREQLTEDSKALGKMKFNDLPSEDEWFSIQSNF